VFDSAGPSGKPEAMRNYHGMEIAWANRLVQTSRVDFGRVKYIPGGYCGPRRQRDYQLVVLQAGGARVTVDDETLILPAEHAVLFLPGHREHFVFSAEQGTEHVWCSIRPRFMPVELRWRLARAPRMAPCSELMHRLFAAARTSPARYLWLTRVERGVAMLRDTGLTVAEVSARCGCKNPFHFSRLVKRNQGMSPREVRRCAWR